VSAANQAVGARQALRRYVLDNERTVLVTRYHWARLIEPTLTALGALVAVVLLVELAAPVVGERADVLWWLWLIAFGRLALRFVEWRVEWFAATDKRMLRHTGIVTHKLAMMPLRSVTDLSYSRSVLGRLLGYGEFVLESAGQDQPMRRIPWVPSPDANYRVLCSMLFAPMGPAGAPLPPPRGVVVLPGAVGRPTVSAVPGSAFHRADTQPIPLPRLEPAGPDPVVISGRGWDQEEREGRSIRARPPRLR
jgi:hypothetical protein